MPLRKKKIIGPASVTSRPRRSMRSQRPATRNKTAASSNAIPDVYQEMLVEAASDSAEDFMPSPRPAKRSKLSVDDTTDVDTLFRSSPPISPVSQDHQDTSEVAVRPQQVVYDDFEGSDESDVEFEDVELEPAAQSASEDESHREIPLQIDLSKSAFETAKRTVQRRRPISKVERLLRLDVHKWHLLSLIGHGIYRNSWCNNEKVHSVLKPLVSRKMIKLLHIDDSKALYERNHSFNKAIEEICAIWRRHWNITTHGMRRSYWREDVDARAEADETEDLEFEDFESAARVCRGSRDLGAQLFTALLRSVAVDVRLVFSLQVLPFTGAAKAETPSKTGTKPDYIYAPPQNFAASASNTLPFVAPKPRLKKSKKIIDSPYPIFWTEVLTPNQTWIPLDPTVRMSIAKPKTQFEPPLSDSLNSMTYVIAYEEDNSVRDVTRRYAQWFNAKTRKMRVESTKNGEQWYASAMAVLSKRLREPRDSIEDDELARRANSEGMPNNIQDFKNHPIYVLERHMRANEVLQPKREVGKVNVGTAKHGKIESVFRRQDVHLCRTADAWYRRGRDVKLGEQPLKRVQPKSQKGIRGQSAELSEDEEQETDGIGLYAEYQTNVYKPPPVVDGLIPKNAYGNLDVYVPSMIPPGAVHIIHVLAASAAKFVGIDFAEAVTGFEFKGRQGTAVVNGIVVAEQFTAAVAAIIEGLERLDSEEVQEARSRILLSMWKKMLQSLRVRDRVEAEYGPTNTRSRKGRFADNEDGDDDDDSAYKDEDEEMADDVGGGFVPESEPTEEKIQEQAVNLQNLKSKMPAMLPEEIVSVPIRITRSPHKLAVLYHNSSQNDIMDDGANDELFEDHDEDVPIHGGFVPEVDDQNDTGGGFMVENGPGEQAGGFMPDDDENVGGGFMPEDTSPLARSPPKPSTFNTSSSSKPRSSLDNTFVPSDSSQFGTKHRSSSLAHTKPSQHIQNPANDTTDALHSDVEEDSALQYAIAESLATQVRPPQAIKESSVQEPGQNLAAPTEIDAGHGTVEAAAAVAAAAGSDAHSPMSLLSHDPNEDDEEPEWLNEALDE